MRAFVLAPTMCVREIACVLFLVIMLVAAGVSMGVGGYVVKAIIEVYETGGMHTNVVTDSNFHEYSWEYSLIATAVVEVTLVVAVVFFFVVCMGVDLCWFCTKEACMCCCLRPLGRMCCPRCAGEQPKSDIPMFVIAQDQGQPTFTHVGYDQELGF